MKKQTLKRHIVDTTAILVVVTPIGSFIEMVLAGMSVPVSLRVRLFIGILFFLGYGGLLARVRDYLKMVFHITTKTSEYKVQAFDMVYLCTMTIVTNPIMYLLSNARGIQEIVVGTGGNAIVGLFIGGLVGYTIDLFRSFTGLGDNHRTPRCLRGLSRTTRKCVMAFIILFAVLLTTVVYSA